MSLSVNSLLYRRYRIVHLLGQGGMGAVYRAWDTHIDADVAVKELIAQTDDEKELEKLQEQFQQEARILARLNHPNLVRVTDFFQEEGNAYLVMNFVEGQSLAQKIASEGALPEALILKWAAQLLSALDYCHARNVIHRDIKPENVIIRPRGQAVLVDFGLMKLWNPDDPKTKTVVRGMGTPAYAPPEQYDVVIGSTTPRSDVYSFGAMLYHTLVGEAPPTASYRMAYPEQFALTWPATLGISSQTRIVVERAMEIATSQRWPSASAMANALGVDVSEWDTAEGSVSALTLPGDGGTRKITPPEARVPKQGLRRLPIWGWGIILLGLVGLIVGAGTVLKVFTPAAVLSPTPAPALTLTPSVTPTPAPTATRTSAPTATRTPTPRPTATKRATATYSPTPELTDTPVPAGLTPESLSLIHISEPTRPY